MFMSIYSGWQLVIMSRFDLEKACQIIQDFKITFAYVPPPIILAFGKSPVVDKYDLTSLKVMHSGAAPLTTELMELFWKRLKLPVKQGYGLSETSPVTHAQMPDEWFKFMGSVGKLVPNMESMIVDLEGKEVPLGEEGELWVRGPNVFGGYFQNEEKTAEAFSADGWFRTGDIFKMDKHGNFYCVDRLKELIKYSKLPSPHSDLPTLSSTDADIANRGLPSTAGRARRISLGTSRRRRCLCHRNLRRQPSHRTPSCLRHTQRRRAAGRREGDRDCGMDSRQSSPLQEAARRSVLHRCSAQVPQWKDIETGNEGQGQAGREKSRPEVVSSCKMEGVVRVLWYYNCPPAAGRYLHAPSKTGTLSHLDLETGVLLVLEALNPSSPPPPTASPR